MSEATITKGEATRARIVEAAYRLFIEQGFHATPMAQIADRAGVGAGTIYRYFPDKDGLIRAAHEEVRDRFHAAAVRDYPEGGALRHAVFANHTPQHIRRLLDAIKELL